MPGRWRKIKGQCAQHHKSAAVPVIYLEQRLLFMQAGRRLLPTSSRAVKRDGCWRTLRLVCNLSMHKHTCTLALTNDHDNPYRYTHRPPCKATVRRWNVLVTCWPPVTGREEAIRGRLLNGCGEHGGLAAQRAPAVRIGTGHGVAPVAACTQAWVCRAWCLRKIDHDDMLPFLLLHTADVMHNEALPCAKRAQSAGAPLAQVQKDGRTALGCSVDPSPQAMPWVTSAIGLANDRLP